MTTLPVFVSRTTQLIKTNAPEILTALGASGVITTSYLSARAGFKAAGKLESSDPKAPIKDKAKKVWKLYIPAGLSGAATIGCIIFASRGNSRRTVAAATAYSLTERAFSEYREKVVEQLGQNKEQKIRDDIVQEKVTKTSSNVVVIGSGDVLCREDYTGRYFRSDMEMLRRAMNDINAKMMQSMYVDLDEFYDKVGLPSTGNSDLMGWNSDRLMELEFSSALTPSGEPCLSFSYNYVKPL